MKQLSLLIVFFTILLGHSQTLSIERLEKEWTRLYNEACELYDNNKYSEAESIAIKSVELLEINNAENSPASVKTLILLGKIYHNKGDDSIAGIINDKLLAASEYIKPESARYIHYLYEMGIYYSVIGNFSEAIKVLQNAIERKETVMGIPGMYPKLLHQLAFAYCSTDSLYQAIDLEKQCIMIEQDAIPEYRIMLAYYYYLNSEWLSLEDFLPECYDCAREYVLRNFSMSKAVERAEFWEKNGSFFYQFLPVLAFSYPSNLIVSMAYNAALFSKGMLLAAENKSTEIVLGSNAEEWIKLYERYKSLKANNHRSYEESGEMEALSDVLLRYQKEHKYDFRTDFRVGWRDVQNQLGDKDLVIEFVTVPQECGAVRYVALSIKKEYDSPHLTKLTDFTDYLSSNPNNIYLSNELYDMIWGALEAELRDVENVYFSPIGAFYNTGIEYLPDEMGVNFCYKYNTFRLSSTKEIVLRKMCTSHNAILFGGADYDSATDKDAIDEQKETQEEIRPVLFDSLQLDGIRNGMAANGFPYLPGTLKETKAISQILKESNVNVEVHTGSDANESSFKRLSGVDAGIIHIATHGFYFTANITKPHSSLEQYFRNMIFFEDGVQTHQFCEDKRLTRSGLILAGANHTLYQKEGKTMGNDGILYAYEIAGLNLCSVDLTVLSACRSGLGDVSVSEGVFGLQRGFKSAGVNSIMMSLWNVSDDATQILMTEFYHNLGQGETKHEALLNAQLTLRTINGGIYDDPLYWAAFILLDALD